MNKSNVDVLAPSLRFQGFNKNWIKGPLGPLTIKVGSGVTPRGGSSVYTPTGVLFIRSQNVKNDQLDLSDPTFIPPSVHSVMSGSRVQPKDVLLNITGASIGRSCVVPGRVQEANVNQHVCILRLEDVLDPNFLQSFLSSWRGQKLVYQSQAGGGREGLNFENIRTFIFNIPELPEQQKIAAFLSAVDTKSQQLQRKKELLEQYKKGIMQKIFSQEIKFKDEDGNDYPDWEDKRLSDTLKSIPTKPYQILKSDILPEGPFPVIDQGQKDIAGYTHNSPKLFNNGACIVYGDHTTIVKYIDYDFVVGADGTKLLQSETENMKFMFYNILFNNIEPEGYKRHFSILKTITLNIPCLDEQSKIEVILSSIDKKTLIVNNELTAMTDFKKGLLQQMFI